MSSIEELQKENESLRKEIEYLNDQIKQYGVLDGEFIKFALTCGFGRAELIGRLRKMLAAADVVDMIDIEDSEIAFALGSDLIDAIREAKAK